MREEEDWGEGLGDWECDKGVWVGDMLAGDSGVVVVRVLSS